jgi:hypothetical protein
LQLVGGGGGRAGSLLGLKRFGDVAGLGSKSDARPLTEVVWLLWPPSPARLSQHEKIRVGDKRLELKTALLAILSTPLSPPHAAVAASTSQSQKGVRWPWQGPTLSLFQLKVTAECVPVEVAVAVAATVARTQ